MDMKPSDRRSFVRVPFNTEAEVQVDKRVIRSSEGIDVSLSGLRLASNEAVDPGTLCQVKIILQTPETRLAIEAKGTVIRSTAGTLGIQFTELDLDSYLHLRQLILYNTEEPEKAEQEFSSHWGIRTPRRPSGQ